MQFKVFENLLADNPILAPKPQFERIAISTFEEIQQFVDAEA